MMLDYKAPSSPGFPAVSQSRQNDRLVLVHLFLG